MRLNPDHSKSQLAKLPAEFPLGWADRQDLIFAVFRDESFSGLERIATLFHLATTLASSQPEQGSQTCRNIVSCVVSMSQLVRQLDPQERAELPTLQNSSGEALWTAIGRWVQATAPHLECRDLCSLFVACGRLGFKEPGAIATLIDFVKPKVDLFSLPERARSAWAIARLGPPYTEFLPTITDAIKRQRGDLSPRDTSMIAWTLATAGVRDEVLLQRLAHEAIRMRSELFGQTLANIVWAFGRLEYTDRRLFDGLAEVISKRCDSLGPQGLANIIWGLARVNFRDEALLGKLTEQCLLFIPSFRAIELGSLAWSYAVLHYRDERLLTALSREAIGRIAEIDNQGLTNISWAATSLAWQNERLFTVVLEEATRRADALTFREKSNLAWALCLYHPELVCSIYPRDSLMQPQEPQHWLQGYVALVVAGAVDPTEHFTELEAHANINSYPPTSRFEQDVHRVLRRTFPRPEFDISVAPTVATIRTNFIVSGNGQRVIVECDGTFYHRLGGPDGGGCKGSDLIQDKVFEACGYQVFHLSATRFYGGQESELIMELRECLAAPGSKGSRR